MSFETNATPTLWATRASVIAGVMRIGEKVARGEQVAGEAKAMVPVQALLVAAIDRTLESRGEVVPPTPWAE